MSEPNDLQERAYDEAARILSALRVKPPGYTTETVALLRAQVRSRLASFAESEADRRERECIEAVCWRCEEGQAATRDEYECDTAFGPATMVGWLHDDGDHCDASPIHENRYQREKREKGGD